MRLMWSFPLFSLFLSLFFWDIIHARPPIALGKPTFRTPQSDISSYCEKDGRNERIEVILNEVTKLFESSQLGQSTSQQSNAIARESFSLLTRLHRESVGISTSLTTQKASLCEDDRFYHLTKLVATYLNPKVNKEMSRDTFSLGCQAIYILSVLINPILKSCKSEVLSAHFFPLFECFVQFKSKFALSDQDIAHISYAGTRVLSSLSSNSLAERSDLISTLTPSVLESFSVITERYDSLQLPFKVLPHALDEDESSIYRELLNQIPFRAETLVTRDGKKVTERRETCWMAEKNIGGLAYSGKIMTPVPFVPSVERIRDKIDELTGIWYDCCLINHYPDGNCACAFHSDPDHGRIFAQDTVIASFGETRRFNLRELMVNGDKKKKPPLQEQNHYSFHLFANDLMWMHSDCQDTYQHAILPSEGEQNNEPRISIVFKKTLPGPGGRRGHGIPKN